MRSSAYREWSVRPVPDEPLAWSAAYPTERASRRPAAAVPEMSVLLCAEAQDAMEAAARLRELAVDAAALRALPALQAARQAAEAPAARSPRRSAAAAWALRGQEAPVRPWPEPSSIQLRGLHQRPTRAQGRSSCASCLQ